MKKNEIINTLQTGKQFLTDNYGVVSIALFDSYAKGLENTDSVLILWSSLQSLLTAC
jgi:predicted nucleotidyltransferase